MTYIDTKIKEFTGEDGLLNISKYDHDRLKQAMEDVVAREREKLSKKVVLYINPIQSYYELSHEDRLKLNADEIEVYLGDKVDKVWGDDWNDAPDEHNSGIPYEDTVEGLEVIKISLGKTLTIPPNTIKD